jgi:hypothetical protein
VIRALRIATQWLANRIWNIVLDGVIAALIAWLHELMLVIAELVVRL